MPLADMRDPEEEEQLVESVVGIDDVSGEPVDPTQSHCKSSARGDERIQRTRSLSSCSSL